MAIAAFFFDLGDTLGEAIVTLSPARLKDIVVFPYVPQLLQQLRQQGIRLGIISNTGSERGDAINAVLDRAALLAYFDPELLIYSADTGLTKADPRIFREAAGRAGVAPGQCLFVGEDAAERCQALAAGMRVAPHPLLAQAAAAGESLYFARIQRPDGGTPSPDFSSLVPVHRSGRAGAALYAIVPFSLVERLRAEDFLVDTLGAPDLPLANDLFLVRDAPRGFGRLADDRRIVSRTASDLLVAWPPERSMAELHLGSMRHGHTVKLTPSVGLLRPAAVAAAARQTAFLDPVLPPPVAAPLEAIAATSMAHRIGVYSGAVPMENGQSIASRHVAHPDNSIAVEAVADELARVGRGSISVCLHRFSHRGRTLHNIEGEIAGTGPGVVLITAHLDSTGANSPGFEQERDPAPGADDDASGVAAVITVAEALAKIVAAGWHPQQTVRFVLFNAEEEGLVGSRAYAKLQRTRLAEIVAVLQMDMIGYNRLPPRTWEVHAGFATNPAVERRSLDLAELLRAAMAAVSPSLEGPQIYRTTAQGPDPADGRSDHTSFQEQGYPAIVASEDLFIGPDPASPAAEGNPHYHETNDTFVDAVYAADIARAVGAAGCLLAGFRPASPVPHQSHALEAITPEQTMTRARGFDSRRIGNAVAQTESSPHQLRHERVNPLSGTTSLAEAAPFEARQTMVEKALRFLRSQGLSAAGGSAEFVPDPNIRRTSSGAAAINMHQYFRGIPLFQMTRLVRFDTEGQLVDAAGDSTHIPPDLRTTPVLDAVAAVQAAVRHLEATGPGEQIHSPYGPAAPMPAVPAEGYVPEVLAAFPALATQATVLSKGPFENAIPAHLVIFVGQAGPRLAWHMLITLPDYVDQYLVIVAADKAEGELLYSKSTINRASAVGLVFEYSPGVAPRKEIRFPRPLGDYPVVLSIQALGFPPDWTREGKSDGNSVIGTLGATSQILNGALQPDGSFLFAPADANSNDQKLLNIFYFCNYMHDFLYILGFDEEAGNFQRINFSGRGRPNDPVRARAHAGSVPGIANMSTGPDGQPPVMNMGPVGNRHTAFDLDVVGHEYVHGLTNRLVGGAFNASALEEPQSAGMGEGWSDYFPLTLQGCLLGREKSVIGDWVVDSRAGIRRGPYDDSYPFGYGSLANESDEHNVGEVWCAALMKMTRDIRTVLVDAKVGYQLSWQIVVDGLKLTPPNPTFLDGRDAILRALDDLKTSGRISAELHGKVLRAVWTAFARFGMGAAAQSLDAGLGGILADSTLPPDLIA